MVAWENIVIGSPFLTKISVIFVSGANSWAVICYSRRSIMFPFKKQVEVFWMNACLTHQGIIRNQWGSVKNPVPDHFRKSEIDRKNQNSASLRKNESFKSIHFAS